MSSEHKWGKPRDVKDLLGELRSDIQFDRTEAPTFKDWLSGMDEAQVWELKKELKKAQDDLHTTRVDLAKKENELKIQIDINEYLKEKSKQSDVVDTAAGVGLGEIQEIMEAFWKKYKSFVPETTINKIIKLDTNMKKLIPAFQHNELNIDTSTVDALILEMMQYDNTYYQSAVPEDVKVPMLRYMQAVHQTNDILSGYTRYKQALKEVLKICETKK